MTSQIDTPLVEHDAPVQVHTPSRSIPGSGGRMAAMGALAAVALLATWWPTMNATNTVQSAQASVPIVANASEGPVERDATVSPSPVASVDETASTAAANVVEPETAAVAAVEPEVVEAIEVTPESDAPDTGVEPVEEPVEAADEPLEAGQIFVDRFSEGDPRWSPMTGQWEVSDGLLLQTDPGGFDYINQLDVEVPDQFDLNVRMRASGPELGGGVVFGQSVPGSRKGAYLVDFTAGGSFLRWGRYGPDSGAYEYLGGIDVGIDGTEWHELHIEVRSDSTLVYLDDAYIGGFEAVASGDVGLAASMSAVEFDDVVIVEAT